MDNSGKMVWFFAGAALGATVALLYAPQAGEDTRRLIRKKARKGHETISDASRDALEKGRDLYEKGRQMADEAADLFERTRRRV